MSLLSSSNSINVAIHPQLAAVTLTTVPLFMKFLQLESEMMARVRRALES